MKVLVFDTETTGLPPRNKKFKNTKEMYLNYPHIVQLSWILVEFTEKTQSYPEMNVIDLYDCVIKIDKNIHIPCEASNIHKITHDICDTHGIPIKHALELFKISCQNTDILVGHNIKFDYEMIIAECYRNNIRYKDLFCMNRQPTKQTPNKNENKHETNDNNMIDIDDDDIDNDIELNVLFNTPIQMYIPRYCTMNSNIRFCNIISQSKFGGTYLKKPKLIELYKKLFGIEPKNLHNSIIDVLCTFRCFIHSKFDIDFISLFTDENEYNYYIDTLIQQFSKNCYSNIKDAFYSILG